MSCALVAKSLNDGATYALGSGVTKVHAAPVAPLKRPHAPPRHTDAVPGHTRPHMPQLAASVCSALHVAPQKVWPDGHAHAPPWQVCPPAHLRPHIPQLLPSVFGSTQVCMPMAP